MSTGPAQVDVVVSFDFDAEEVWIGEDPANAERPGTLSQGAYGAKVAVPLLLDLLHRLDLPATFFVPGRVGERYPQRVEEILAAGHEIGHHGYTHTSPAKLTREQEEAELVRGPGRPRRRSAPTSVGYRSPSWDFSPSTLDLLSSTASATPRTSWTTSAPICMPDHGIVELPVHWTFDDAPHFWFDLRSWNKTIRTAAEVRSLWAEELEGIAAYRRSRHAHDAPADHRPSGSARDARGLPHRGRDPFREFGSRPHRPSAEAARSGTL